MIREGDGAITDNKLYKTNGDFLLRKIAGEAVLIPVGGGADQLNGMITLNETFQFIWEMFKQPCTISSVIEAAKEEYEDSDGTIEKDIHRFVEESLQYGFLKEEE